MTVTLGGGNSRAHDVSGQHPCTAETHLSYLRVPFAIIIQFWGFLVIYIECMLLYFCKGIVNNSIITK